MPPLIIFFLILPILAVGVLLVIGRSAAVRPLVPALVLSGITTALTTAFFSFTSGTVPIGPYETGPGAWWPVAGQVLLAAYVGFGIGVILASLIGVPWQLIANRRRPR